MSKLTKIQLACVAMVALFCAFTASAFNVSSYATTSKLATGKWVKIIIPESGVYEVTYDEMREMGFSNPSKVKIYGSGGYAINEVLNGQAPDDLVSVPIIRGNDKICFYGCGPIRYTISDSYAAPYYTRTFNPYSQVGCYFLTEDNSSDMHPMQRTPVVVSTFVDKPTSLDFCHHEKELASLTNSGKEMLGEDFSSGNILVDFDMPGIADSTIVVYTTLAANTENMCYANAIIHSGGEADTTSFPLSTSRINIAGGSYVIYNTASPHGAIKLKNPMEHGQFQPFLKATSDTIELSPSVAMLDLFIITYTHDNVIGDNVDNQFRMGYGATQGNERFMMPNASSDIVVWNINTPSNPIEMPLEEYDDESGQGIAFFTSRASTSLYVAFDPTKTLKKISSYEPVENQNLHGMAVPDMLIITDKMFMEQAQRIADLHATLDGIDVAVVDHEKIFNEFSSGTRDGMAYRLLCKMLYDRNSTKFKNLLLMGTGNHDNRELLGRHEGQLLTYQSACSNLEDNFNYTCDDFFGFLTDNSGASLDSDVLSIGVGRITSANVEEARSDVDKLIEYYANPDYGVWRNRTFVISDSPDKGLYMFQGEGYKNQIDNELGTGMHVTTAHNTQYPRSTTETNLNIEKRTATEAKQLISNTLKDGAYFVTYVGHAGPLNFSKYNFIWTVGDVANTNYRHLPIMATACCDVARYDGDSRGIAELMFHKRDGGAIAMLTSSRMVYASGNDLLNRYFISSLFSYEATGKMTTLGEAYMNAKRTFTTGNTNKLSFLLLGDPAMKVNYPISRFNITSVNGTDMTGSATTTIYPLMRFQVNAQVVDADGNLDTSFNGDATVTLYDKQDVFTSVTGTLNNQTIERDIYFNREKLAEVTGRVVNGQFTGYVIAPRKVQARNETVLLRVYAHKDNSDYMVNGFTTNIRMMGYDENQAITDTQNPVITSMFINDETSFADGAIIDGNSVLYITATDDQGINVQSNSGDVSMSLVLDNGRPSYGDITSYATLSDEGKQVAIEFPLNNLAEGLHTLTYTVYDMLGNSATRTITFMVGQSGTATLTADMLPAYVDGVVNFDLETDLSRTPEVVVRVTDATGNLVWMTTTNSFPVTWDMKDMNGNKVHGGLYRYFGTYHDGSNYGGTPIKKLIVLDALKRANN